MYEAIIASSQDNQEKFYKLFGRKINFYGNYGVDTGKFETFATFNREDKALSQKIDYLDHSISHYIKNGLDFLYEY